MALPVINEYSDRTEYIWVADGDQSTATNYKVVSGFKCNIDICYHHRQPDIDEQVSMIKACSETGVWVENANVHSVTYNGITNPLIPATSILTYSIVNSHFLASYEFDVVRAKGKDYNYLHNYFSTMNL